MYWILQFGDWEGGLATLYHKQTKWHVNKGSLLG
jgi:hypothetical protein